MVCERAIGRDLPGKHRANAEATSSTARSSPVFRGVRLWACLIGLWAQHNHFSILARDEQQCGSWLLYTWSADKSRHWKWGTALRGRVNHTFVTKATSIAAAERASPEFSMMKSHTANTPSSSECAGHRRLVELPAVDSTQQSF